MSSALGTQPTTEADGVNGLPRRHGDTEEWWVTGLRPVTEIERMPDSQALLGRIVLVSLSSARSCRAERGPPLSQYFSFLVRFSSLTTHKPPILIEALRHFLRLARGRSCKAHRAMLIEAPFNETSGEIVEDYVVVEVK